MNFQILFLFYLSLKIGVLTKMTRIVGGKNADIKEFPFLVSITFVDNNKHTCGGTIISESFILTAAHCVFNKQILYRFMVIYSGRTDMNTYTGQKFSLKTVYIHPEYTNLKSKEAMNRHDIAVLKIEGYIEFNEYQRKAKLPTKNIRYGEIATIAGWGLTKFPSTTNTYQLQKTMLTILENSVCSKKVPFYIHEDQLCAYEKLGVGICVGDSGGPLILNGEIIGIISIGIPCATGVPDVFTNVYKHLNFIKSII